MDLQSAGINRYIMECKSGLNVFTSVGVNELIDTLWNVNAAGVTIAVALFKN